jgi:hypothetical protein
VRRPCTRPARDLTRSGSRPRDELDSTGASLEPAPRLVVRVACTTAGSLDTAAAARYTANRLVDACAPGRFDILACVQTERATTHDRGNLNRSGIGKATREARRSAARTGESCFLATRRFNHGTSRPHCNSSFWRRVHAPNWFQDAGTCVITWLFMAKDKG